MNEHISRVCTLTSYLLAYLSAISNIGTILVFIWYDE